jgi:hypothetical protein
LKLLEFSESGVMEMKKKEATPAGNKAPATGNSPSNALPLGTSAKIPIIPGYGPAPRIGDIQISLLEVSREKEAAARILSSGNKVEPLKAGFETVLLQVKAEYVSKGKDAREQTYKMSEGQFMACSADGGAEYPVSPFPGRPEEELIGHTFTAGETREGWLICQLPKNDKTVLLVFRRENVDNHWGLWSDVWFKLA